MNGTSNTTATLNESANGNLNRASFGNHENTEIKMELNGTEQRRRERKGIIYQVLMSLIANSAALGPAMSMGYSAVALGPMTSESSDVKIDSVQANWIATTAALGIPVGCALVSLIMRRGRKISLLTTSVICLIGWVTIYLAGTYEQILIGRVITGISGGLASVPSTVYVAEVSGPKLRSTMITWTSVSIAIGVLVVYIFGYIFKENWRAVAITCALFPVISGALTMIWLPESPIWYRDRGRMDHAIATLKKFRGVPQNEQPSATLLFDLQTKPVKKKQNLMKHIFRRNALIPFFTMLSYFFFQQFSGIFVVVYYAVDIIQSAGIKIDPYLGAVLIGFMRLISTMLASGVSAKFGRRIPSIASGSGMTIFMGMLSIYLFATDKGYSINDGGIFPVICVLMYIFTSTFGFLVIPFAMVGEVYPAKVKDLLSGLTTCTGYLFSSIAVKTYPDMLDVIGKHGVFLFYALISFAGTIFISMFLPETKGKTLSEIEEMFGKKKKSENSEEKKRCLDLCLV